MVKAEKKTRPYQEEAIQSVHDNLSQGIKHQLIVMSMGMGKTFTAVKIEESLKSFKTMWLTDDERLLEQSAMAFIREKFDDSMCDHIEKEGFINYCRNGGRFAGSNYKMSVVKADLFDTSGDIVFCSAQTLWRRLSLMDPNLFDVMIIDEAHCFGANTYFKGISHFNVRLRLGLTATPYRDSGIPLSDIFEKIVYEYGMDKGIKNGYLCELDAIRIKTNVNLDKVHTLAGEFNQAELSNEINTLARNNLIADAYLKYALGRQAIGFACDIQHAVNLTEAFKLKGIKADVISSEESITGDKSQKIKLYKAGEIDVLWNVNLVSKGFDHPNTGCTIAAAPTKSLVRYLQGPAGRAGRLKDAAYVAKFGQRAIILDITDLTTKHSIVNAWELDKKKPIEERTFVTQEKKLKLLEERNKPKAVITHRRDEDEIVNLLSIPKVEIGKYGGLQKPASEAQLAAIAKWGYDIVNEHYTMEQVAQIFNMQQVTQKQLNLLKYKGYDTSNGCSIAEFKKAMAEIEKREKQAIIKQHTPANGGNPFF